LDAEPPYSIGGRQIGGNAGGHKRRPEAARAGRPSRPPYRRHRQRCQPEPIAAECDPERLSREDRQMRGLVDLVEMRA
jgi:hypothetical protein